MKNIFISTFFLLIAIFVKGQEEAQRAFNVGVHFLKKEMYREAELKFTEAIQNGISKDGLKMSYIYKAFALNGQNKYDSAIFCFDKAIEIDSLDPASYTDRGKTYTYQKQYEHAIIDFNMVLILDSNGEQAQAAYFYLGKIKMLQGKDEEAITYFDKLLELVTTDAEGYFLRATAKSNIMDINGSIDDYDLAIKYNPRYMEAYANRGVQKINKLPTYEKIGKHIDCLPDPCSDLLKARELGDSTVEEMIFLYCGKCK